MEGLKLLKNYPMPEAIYCYVFGISEEELKNSSPDAIIKDREHLKENVDEALSTLRDRDRVILQQLLRDKLSLREVGELHGISGARVSYIANKALQMLCHPSRKCLLDGTWRQARAEEAARMERKATVDATWEKVGDELERQKSRQATHISTVSLLGLKELSLSPICEQKLNDLGIKTVGELLERFPYDPQTNGLTGLTIADGIDEDDYREIWGALFLAGTLVHTPELPDFNALKKAEQVMEAREYGVTISDLGMSVKSYNFLMRRGIETVGELLDKLHLTAREFLMMNKDDAVEKIRGLSPSCAKEIADYVRDKLEELYPEIAQEAALADPAFEQTLSELNARVRAISNGNSYITKVYPRSSVQTHTVLYNYTYARCTHKSTAFRVGNVLDSERPYEYYSGKNGVLFNLPEELDELVKFVEHDEKLYRDAHSEG